MMPTTIPATPFRHNPMVEHGTRDHTNKVVIHTTEGATLAGAENWFKNPAAGGVGAHIIISDTAQVQIADLDAVCWHAPGANQDGVGIEHVAFASYPKTEWLKKKHRRMLRASANRTAWLCYHYKLGSPKHKRNVLGHVDLPAGGHHDPGTGFPWWFYMYLCRRAYKMLVKTQGTRWTDAK